MLLTQLTLFIIDFMLSGLIPNSILRGQFDYIPPEDKALEAVLGTRLRESEIWEKMNQLQLTPEPSSENGDSTLNESNEETAGADKTEQSDSDDTDNEVGTHASEFPELSWRNSSVRGYTLPSMEESECHVPPLHSSGTGRAPQDLDRGAQQLPRRRQDSSGAGNQDQQPALSKSSSRKAESDIDNTSIQRKRSKPCIRMPWS